MRSTPVDEGFTAPISDAPSNGQSFIVSFARLFPGPQRGVGPGQIAQGAGHPRLFLRRAGVRQIPLEVPPRALVLLLFIESLPHPVRGHRHPAAVSQTLPEGEGLAEAAQSLGPLVAGKGGVSHQIQRDRHLGPVSVGLEDLEAASVALHRPPLMHETPEGELRPAESAPSLWNHLAIHARLLETGQSTSVRDLRFLRPLSGHVGGPEVHEKPPPCLRVVDIGLQRLASFQGLDGPRHIPQAVAGYAQSVQDLGPKPCRRLLRQEILQALPRRLQIPLLQRPLGILVSQPELAIVVPYRHRPPFPSRDRGDRIYSRIRFLIVVLL